MEAKTKRTLEIKILSGEGAESPQLNDSLMLGPVVNMLVSILPSPPLVISLKSLTPAAGISL